VGEQEVVPEALDVGKGADLRGERRRLVDEGVLVQPLAGGEVDHA